MSNASITAALTSNYERDTLRLPPSTRTAA